MSIYEHITEVVEKSLTCGKIEYGYVKYRCLICNEEYIHGFLCKSKFCTKCGRMYSINWAEKQASNMLKVKLRQDAIFGYKAIASLEDEIMPVLKCPNCGSKFEYKKTDNR